MRPLTNRHVRLALVALAVVFGGEAKGLVGLVQSQETAIRLSLDFAGVIRVPADTTSFLSRVTPDHRQGCLYVTALPSPLYWSTWGSLHGVPGGFVWTKSEKLPHFTLTYGQASHAGGQTLVMSSMYFTLAAGIRGDDDIKRILDIARTWTPLRGKCLDCAPLRREPPSRERSDTRFEGCAEPLLEPSKSLEMPLTPSPPGRKWRHDDWTRAFPAVDQVNRPGFFGGLIP
jgi:hypothetical protein